MLSNISRRYLFKLFTLMTTKHLMMLLFFKFIVPIYFIKTFVKLELFYQVSSKSSFLYNVVYLNSLRLSLRNLSSLVQVLEVRFWNFSIILNSIYGLTFIPYSIYDIIFKEIPHGTKHSKTFYFSFHLKE